MFSLYASSIGEFLHVLNTILSEFIPFSIHSSCWMQGAKSGQNMQALEDIF